MKTSKMANKMTSPKVIIVDAATGKPLSKSPKAVAVGDLIDGRKIVRVENVPDTNQQRVEFEPPAQEMHEVRVTVTDAQGLVLEQFVLRSPQLQTVAARVIKEAVADEYNMYYGGEIRQTFST